MLAPVIASLVMLVGCSNVRLYSVTNAPPIPDQVTHGDFRITGAVKAHLADDGGTCGIFDSQLNSVQVGGPTAKRIKAFLAYLPTTLNDRPNTIDIEVPGAPGPGTYTADRVFGELIVGDAGNGAAASTGQSTRSLWMATRLRGGGAIGSLTVTINPDGKSGRAEGDLSPVILTPRQGTTAASLATSAGAPVHIVGTFSCVQPSY